MNEDLKKFKSILEYFVKQMVRVCKDKNEENIDCPDIEFSKEDIKTDIPKSGRGYKGDTIQSDMEGKADVQNEFKNGFNNQKICISIDATKGFRRGSYLHLVSCDRSEGNITNETAGTNINPVFKKEENREEFIGLQVGPSQNSPTYVFPPLEYTFEELGLIQSTTLSPEEQEYNLQTFFDYFMEMRKAELMGALTYKGKEQLLATHNMIMTGAPGTGKTWSAKNIAAWIICNKSYEKLNDKEKGTFNNHCELVQFHPSYDYTDFVEGLRPIAKNNNNQNQSNNDIGFGLKDGVFKRFCAKALNNDKDHVFIIDEINRGELSKIFGELFYSIDPGYRGPEGAVLTQYANMLTGPNVFDNHLKPNNKDNDQDKKYGHFFVPKNVYIIGTMNDIDRSVESMDFAMRRRFSFIEVKANDREDMWTEDWKDIAKMCMEAINEKIEEIPGLSSAYHIGPAYFKKLNDYGISTGGYDFFKLWDNHLYGVIFEYLRGKKDAEKTINKIQDAYLGALCKAMKTRFNNGGKWGEILIDNAKNKKNNIISIDSSIIDEDSAKKYLDKFKLEYKTSEDSNERLTAILNLSNKVKKYMSIGKQIEALLKNVSENENEEE